MNALVKSPFAWLIRREFWESRRGFLWAPFWVFAANLILMLLAIIAGEVQFRRHVGDLSANGSGSFDLNQILQNALSNHTSDLVNALDGMLLSLALVGGIVLSFVVFFYFLGALYDDRRDRSVLFWKSLPVSDTATVLSKVVAGIVIAPLIVTVLTLAAYFGVLVIVSLWFLIHGVNPFTTLWLHVDPIGTWLRLLAMLPLNALWALPSIGWLLLCSAYARGKPFLWAFLLPMIVGVLNAWIALTGLPHLSGAFYWRDIFGRLLFSVVPGGWILPKLGGPGIRAGDFADGSVHSTMDALIGFPAMAHALATPQMWIGAFVGVAMIAAAIWFRRWRDDS